MTPFERDGTEVEALLTDLYLERVLARARDGPRPGRRRPRSGAPRTPSDRLRRDLTRVHPSFRFEERLALRLAEAAAAAAAPGRGRRRGAASSPFRGAGGRASRTMASTRWPTTADDERRELAGPLLIGGALTSAAISIAGAAAYVAWRWARPGRGGSPMVRAARAVRERARIAADATAPRPRLD